MVVCVLYLFLAIVCDHGINGHTESGGSKSKKVVEVKAVLDINVRPIF